LAVVDSALWDDTESAEREHRALNDPSRHRICKRRFPPGEPAEGLGGAAVLNERQSLVAVAT
jgi:hypothetical protein